MKYYKSNAEILTIDDALIKAGNGHKFQIRSLIIISLQFFVAGMLNMAVSQLFLSKNVENGYQCTQPDVTQIGPCSEQQFCKQWKEGSAYTDNIEMGMMVKEYGLLCNKEFYSLVLITCYFVGGSVGSLYYGEQMELRQGRYTIMIETLLLMGITCCASIFSPSVYILSVALFAANFFQRGFFNSSMILFFELSSENLQKIGPPIILAFWGLGEMLVPYIILIFKFPWRAAVLFLVGVPAVILSFLIKFMKESPRMLQNRRMFESARYVIEYIASVNGRQLPEKWLLEDEVKVNELKSKMAAITNENEADIVPQARSYNYSVLFKYKSIRVRMFCLYYLYSVLVIGQFLTGNEIQRVSRMEHTKTYLFMGLIETVGYLASGYAALNYNRKEVLKAVLVLSMWFHIMIAVWPILLLNESTSIMMNAYDKLVYSFMMMTLVMCRVTLSFGFGFITVYALEIFPTSIRHYAFSSLVFLTEFLFIFYDVYAQFCYVLGINTALGVALALFFGQLTMQKLRETYEQPLKENLDELSDELLNNQFYA